jgi:catechol 2,3-dioxygenase-like lactoylglutathione lyase family enzyme
MIAPTYGLTHISLAVADLDRSLAFYRELFGVAVLFRNESQIQVSTPGSKDVIAFELDPQAAGREGGVRHFGFRLTTPEGIDAARARILELGTKIDRFGEFAPGMPYVYVRDPDGYQIEIWFE